MRLRHKGNGVIINVDDETGERMLGGVWESGDRPARRRIPKKDAEDDAGSDRSE